jgi:hypothetical protein
MRINGKWQIAGPADFAGIGVNAGFIAAEQKPSPGAERSEISGGDGSFYGHCCDSQT